MSDPLSRGDAAYRASLRRHTLDRLRYADGGAAGGDGTITLDPDRVDALTHPPLKLNLNRITTQDKTGQFGNLNYQPNQPLEQPLPGTDPMNAEISNYTPSLWERIAAPVREGQIGRALGLSTETAQSRAEDPSQPLLRFEAALPPNQHGALRGAAEFATGMTTPENVLMTAGSGGLGMLEGALGKQWLSRMAAAGFGAGSFYQAYKQVPEFADAMNRQDWPMVRELATKMVTEGGMGALGLHQSGLGSTVAENLPKLAQAPGAIQDLINQLDSSGNPERGSFSNKPVQPPDNMENMVNFAASKIGQGVIKPTAIRRELVSQFGKMPTATTGQIITLAHDLELKNVKLWQPGMALEDIHPLTPETIPTAGKTMKKEDVIRYLNQQTQNSAGPIDLNAPPDVKLQRLLQHGRLELANQLAQPEPKTDFYLVDTPQADADMTQLFPELGTNSEKMTLMHAVSAVLAQGSNPEAEAMNGGRAYAYYRQHGRLPLVQPDDGIPGQNPGKQWSTTSGSDPVAKLQGFIDMFKTAQDPTGLMGLERILTGRYPVGYLRYFNDSIKGKAGQLAPGALILGPKIGSYFLDISGIPQPGATVDMWDSLANYRRLGNMYAPNGKPFVAPREPDRPVFMDVHRILENEFGLQRTESQSGLWHYEKDLYRRLGVPTPVKGRSDGTMRLLDAWGQPRQTVITKQNAPPPPSRGTYFPPQIP